MIWNACTNNFFCCFLAHQTSYTTVLPLDLTEPLPIWFLWFTNCSKTRQNNVCNTSCSNSTPQISLNPNFAVFVTITRDNYQTEALPKALSGIFRQVLYKTHKHHTKTTQIPHKHHTNTTQTLHKHHIITTPQSYTTQEAQFNILSDLSATA